MPSQSSLQTVLVASLLLAGCDSKPDKQPVNPNEVQGSRVLHYRTDQGDFSQPDTSRPEALEAFVLEAGQRRAFQVVMAEDGTFRIPDAPAGKYYLRDGTVYLYTDARAVNLDFHELGRQDTQKTLQQPAVNLTLSNLAPQPFDSYPNWQGVSAQVGLVASIYAQEPIPAGATSVSRLAADYFQNVPAETVLLDGARGDVLYVLGYAESERDGIITSVADRFFTQKVTQRDGEVTTLEGTFQELPRKQLTVDWRLQDFESYRTQVHPDATSRAQNLSIMPTAGGSDVWYGYSGELVTAATYRTPTSTVLDLAYGTPYPASWGEALNIRHAFRLDVAEPGTVLVDGSFALSDTRPVAEALKGPLTPRLSPAQDLTVEGQDGRKARTLGSLAPRLAWAAPRLGTPSVYRVRIRRKSAQPGFTTLHSVATISTTETALDLPPGILEPGQQYVFQVSAMWVPGMDLAAQPYAYLRSTNLAEADTVSGLLSTPAALAPTHTVPAQVPALSAAEALELRRTPHNRSAR